MRRYIPAALLCILGLLPATFAQAPPGPLANQSGPSVPTSVPASGTLRFLATDKDGHPVTDLKVEDLRIRVNKQERKIFSVSYAPDSPKTIGVFFDVSGSHREDRLLDKEVQSISRFLESVWHPGDAGFVVIFADRPATLAKPSGDLRQLVEGMKGVLTAEYRDLLPYAMPFVPVTSASPKPDAARDCFLS